MEALCSYKTDSDKHPGLTGSHSLSRQKMLPVCCYSSFPGDSYALCSCTGGRRFEAHTWYPAGSARWAFPLSDHALHPWVVMSHNCKWKSVSMYVPGHVRMPPMHFLFINLPHSPAEIWLLSYPFYRWGAGGFDGLMTWSKFSHLVGRRARLEQGEPLDTHVLHDSVDPGSWWFSRGKESLEYREVCVVFWNSGIYSGLL